MMARSREEVLYWTVRRMIERGSTEDLSDKLDVFLAAGKLTIEHYTELMDMLGK